MKGIEVAQSADEPAQNKLWITCVTCGITKAFHTPHGVRYFELTHLNHEVKRGKVDLENVETVEEEPTTESTSENLDEEEPAELPTVVLEKLVLSMATIGPEKKHAIRVRGEGKEEKDLFVLNFPVENFSEVKTLVEGGEYVQDEMPPMGRFTWTEQLVDAPDQVRTVAGLAPLAQAAEAPKAEPQQAPQEPKVEVEPEPVKVEPVRAIPRREAKKEVPLLLAKSNYIQETSENRSEAVRISKVLMEFRWNIEPPYGINVLFDDNMSIQSNTGVISANVISRIEDLGYSFVAFEASKGVPTAWFKKKKQDHSQLNLFPDIGEVILPQAPDADSEVSAAANEVPQ